jgi:metallo-beta-lactamase class B
VAYVGGTAIPFNADAQYYDRYLASSKKMAKAAADYGATVLLSNHTEFDDAVFKAHAADDRKNAEANPFDVGADAVARYFAVVEDCTAAAKLRAANRSDHEAHPRCRDCTCGAVSGHRAGPAKPGTN